METETGTNDKINSGYFFDEYFYQPKKGFILHEKQTNIKTLTSKPC